jgi:MinD-like ATPase involved in chromosome partitioning or flagellar assembly
MYIVTFYSYKGGTGRTMAMVNVAMELVAQGSSVLMVDLDLEAPGLDTFCKSPGASKGVVDFVDSYLSTGAVPDVREYVYESRPGADASGRLLVMPSGTQDGTYDRRFRGIDWGYLYNHQDGFLLFEDLKEQWKEVLKVDYVLVDSRTGHTDVGGICTRQLPDAVVIFFFPNEQNRRGLATVVDQIRSETEGPLQKEIKLHFVMSNVPDLDDEDEILAANVERIRETLKYEELAATIHHYNSLLLLDQAVFTLDRPRSRLAQEYRGLARRIRRANLEDREGALEFLEDIGGRLRGRRPLLADLETKISEIIGKHPQDGEVLRQLARLRRRQRKWQEALALLNQAISSGLIDSDVLLARAELRHAAADDEGALSDIGHLFQLPDAPNFDLEAAIRLFIELKGHAEILLDSPALRGLQPAELASVCFELEASPEALSVAQRLLEEKLVTGAGAASGFARNQLTICLIGQGKFAEAKSLILGHEPDLRRLDIYGAFNYAMAEWADARSLPVELFGAVISSHLKAVVAQRDANYRQCIAIAFWAIGDLDNAFKESRRAYDSLLGIQGAVFSCWSYLRVDPGRFLRDIADMDRMFNGQKVIPAYMSRAGISDLGNHGPSSLRDAAEPREG